MENKQKRPYGRRDFLKAGSVVAAVTAGVTERAWPETVAVQQAVGIVHEEVNLTAEDGGRSRGIFYRSENSNPRVGIISMHPVGDNRWDWRALPMAERGIAYFGMAGRYAGNEAHHIHEELLLDVAAGVNHLKQERGIDKVILLGHSGGGQLMCMYQSQAVTPPPERIVSTPAGDPPNLNQYTLTSGDGIILSAAHPGRPVVFRERLDPSVVDESDPFAADPDLDMYDPKNGFRRPPESSKYSEDFLTRYRIAQLARVQRLDAKARSMIAREKFYQKLMEAADFRQRPLSEQLAVERQAVQSQWLFIRRCQADPRYTDLSVDPSDRIVGATGPLHSRPDLGNYSIFRAPQMISPRAFLSSRSSVSSNNKIWNWNPASQTVVLENSRKVTLPLLVICGTADESVPGQERQRILLEAVRSRDKSIVWIVGASHGFNPMGPKAGNGRQREEAVDRMVDWVKKRFPV